MSAFASTATGRALFALCLLLVLPAAQAANNTCVPSLSCSSCVGGSICGFCKTTNTCLEGTSGGSFNGGCQGTSWTWFAQDCGVVCPFTCPDSSCATNLTNCSCTATARVQASFVTNLNGDTNTPNRLDASMELRFASNATFMNAVGGCATYNFTQHARLEYTVVLTDLNRVSQTVAGTISQGLSVVSFPANTFTVGTRYNLTATYYDILNRTSSRSYSFVAISPTAVVTVLTQTVVTVPVNVRLSTSVADPYGTAANEATWLCAGVNDTACPSNITSALASGTNNGLFIAGPIPAGTYTLWLKYKTLRSTNITLVVLCNATELTAEGKCPGKCPAYTCPDATCATALSTCNCTLYATINDAAVSMWPVSATAGVVDPTSALAFTAAANYRQKVGSCSSFDFTPFMTLRWTLLVGSSAVEQSFGSDIVANRSTITLPAKYFTPGTSYTMVVRFFNIDKAPLSVLTSTFTAKAPTPVVSITTRGSKIVVGPTDIRITAVVVDLYKDGTNGTWGCTGVCGTALLEGLRVNGTNEGAFIAGRATTGTSLLTLTYKGVTSDALTVVVMATEVPTVTIVTSVEPVLAPRTYLSVQQLIFAASVRFFENTTLRWSVNGVQYGNTSVFTVPTLALFTNGTLNTVTLRATSVSDAAVYGESQFSVLVAPALTVTLSAVENANNASNPLLALSDSAVVTFTVGNTIEGTVTSYEVGYLSSGLRVRMSRSGSRSVSFVCPIPSSGEKLQVYVDVLVNDRLAVSGYVNASVRMPSAEAAIANQLGALSSTDPAQRAQSAANLGALLKRGATSNASNANDISSSVVASLADVSPASGVPAALVFNTLNAALESSTDKEALAASTKKVAQAYVATLKAEDAGSFLGPLTALPQDSETAALFNTVAGTLAGSATVGGPPVSVSVGGVTLSGQKLLASELASSTTTTGTTSVALAPLPLSDSSATVGVAGSQSSGAALETTSGPKPTSNVTDISLTVNGEAFPVDNLTTEIVLTMDASDPEKDECKYYHKPSKTWKTNGVRKVGYTLNPKKIKCATNHLTAFAGFTGATTTSSSAASAAVSVAVAVLVALVQLLW